ncbi:hypothetical protein Trydic_g1722 [Trypoxylus dichotomus]
MMMDSHNIERKLIWSKEYKPARTTSKAEMNQKKIMLLIWYNYKGFVYFELLPGNQMINSDVHCRRLDKLNSGIQEKRLELVNGKGVCQDSARPQTALVTPKIIGAWLGSDVTFAVQL